MMKVINDAYETLGKLNQSENIDAGAASDDDYLQALADMFGVVATLDGITVEICGSWIWISGDTKPVKDQLKALGCNWSHNKTSWYLKPAGERKGWRGGNFSLDDIRKAHGSAVIKGKAAKRVSK
jgi:hypothetical protein